MLFEATTVRRRVMRVDIDGDFPAAWKILNQEISESLHLFFFQLWIVIVMRHVVVADRHLKESGCSNSEDLLCIFQWRRVFIIDTEDNASPIVWTF